MSDKLEKLEGIYRLIKDPVLIFLSVTLVLIVGAVVSVSVGKGLGPGTALGVMAIASVVLLVGVFIRYHYLDKESRNESHGKIHSLEDTVAGKERDLEALTEEIAALQKRIDAPPISIITKRDYADLIKQWNSAGAGHLLLFNIEMQSFQTDEDIERTWGRLGEMTNIKNVVLLLPEKKVRRWERIVRTQAGKFFAEEANHKFDVCEFSVEKLRDVNKTPSIGFAMYRFGDSAGSGKLHDIAIVFVMSGPFSQLRDPQVPEDDPWWDYHHIIKFFSNHEVVINMDQTWRQCFDRAKTRSVVQVIEDTRPLKPIEPSVLFNGLGVTASRKAELLTHLAERRQIRSIPPLITPDGNDRIPFAIEYSNHDAVQGHCRGAGAEPKPALIWVGGFTERQGTKLPALFERELKQEAVVQFYFEVSPPIEYITLTRYQQDIREVLRYVRQQRVADPAHTVLIARSINGLLGALVAAEDEFRGQLAGVILVAPVFDLIHMIDSYRETRELKKAYVRVERCWRLSPGYTADKWEDPEYGWLEFFGHDVSLTLFADIIRHDPKAFSIEAFTGAVGKISQFCPVHILSNSDDPITGSRSALETLAKAASGTGLIREDNYQYVEINSGHYTVVDGNQYPFAPRQEVRETRVALRKILDRLGVPTESAETAVAQDASSNVAETTGDNQAG